MTWARVRSDAASGGLQGVLFLFGRRGFLLVAGQGAVVDEKITRLGAHDWLALKAAWNCGEVVTRLEELPAALARAFADPKAWLAAQEAAVADQFVLTDVPSGRRGAQAILEWSRLRKR